MEQGVQQARAAAAALAVALPPEGPARRCRTAPENPIAASTDALRRPCRRAAMPPGKADGPCGAQRQRSPPVLQQRCAAAPPALPPVPARWPAPATAPAAAHSSPSVKIAPRCVLMPPVAASMRAGDRGAAGVSGFVRVDGPRRGLLRGGCGDHLADAARPDPGAEGAFADFGGDQVTAGPRAEDGAPHRGRRQRVGRAAHARPCRRPAARAPGREGAGRWCRGGGQQRARDALRARRRGHGARADRADGRPRAALAGADAAHGRHGSRATSWWVS